MNYNSERICLKVLNNDAIKPKIMPFWTFKDMASSTSFRTNDENREKGHPFPSCAHPQDPKIEANVCTLTSCHIRRHFRHKYLALWKNALFHSASYVEWHNEGIFWWIPKASHYTKLAQNTHQCVKQRWKVWKISTRFAICARTLRVILCWNYHGVFRWMLMFPNASCR